MTNYPDLQNKVVLVTGASRRQGIGAAVCRAFAAQGARIFFTTWQPYDGEQPHGADLGGPGSLTEDIRQLGGQVDSVAIDLSESDAAEILLNLVTDRYEVPEILVNNAAYSTRDGYQQLEAFGLNMHYFVNLRATALLSVGLAKRREAAGLRGGRIINLTSGQSLGPMPMELAYVATKGAIEAFSRTLAAEVAHLGLTVNAVDPGVTDTGWMSDDFKAEWVARMGMGRVGLPEDVARLILFLASEAGQWVTGEVIHSRGA